MSRFNEPCKCVHEFYILEIDGKALPSKKEVEQQQDLRFEVEVSATSEVKLEMDFKDELGEPPMSYTLNLTEKEGSIVLSFKKLINFN